MRRTTSHGRGVVRSVRGPSWPPSRSSCHGSCPANWTALLGPMATPWLWLPPLAWVVASLLADRAPRAGWMDVASRRASPCGPLSRWSSSTRRATRLTSSPTWPQPPVPGPGRRSSGRWRSLDGVLVVAGIVLGSLMGGSSAPPPTKTVVRTGGGIHPLAAIVVRGLIRLVLLVVFGVIQVGLWTVAVDAGRACRGVRALRGHHFDAVGRPPPSPGVAGASSRARRWSGGAVGQASAGWGRGRAEHGVWVHPAAVAGMTMACATIAAWPLDGRLTADERELREFS